MGYSLRVTSAARFDEMQAYFYYEELRKGLGEKFVERLKARYEDIRQHPEHYGFIDERKTIRDVVVKGFPYLVFYRILDDVVYILSVFNTYQQPIVWE